MRRFHDHEAIKTHHRGTHRTVSPEATLARVEPFMAAMGITRIANVTGLDTLGIPVVMVTRPNARSVSVSQGKGVDLAAAKASGLMEAIETWHAERITLPLKLGSYEELRPDHALIDVERLPKAAGSRYHPDRPLLWIEGRNLIDQQPLWLPFEMVHTDYTIEQPAGSGCFPANTNGLASGNHLLEAIAHGIGEVIERDALTLWRLQPRSRLRRLLDLGTIDDPACLELLERLEQATVEITVWDATSDVGVACFYCLLMGRDDQVEPEFGAGCHPVPEVALLRAITEAAQARTTYIAGSRDDFSAAIYEETARALRVQACRELIARTGDTCAFGAIPRFLSGSLDEDVAWMLERLQQVGIDQVVAVDLTRPVFQIPVARVVIPGLEGVYKDAASDYAPGRRAQAIMAGEP
ncbi:MAG: YcaO-like family protein [Rhizobiales bacterium]|nr:YcaO-like family protein [Hyphomicrobiales bacterium]